MTLGAQPSRAVGRYGAGSAAFVKIGLGLAAALYVVTALVDLRSGGSAARYSNALVAVGLCAAFVLSLRSTTLGGAVGLFVVYGELLVSVATGGGRNVSIAAFPVLVTASGLLLGEVGAIVAGVLGMVGPAAAVALPFWPHAAQGRGPESVENLLIIGVLSLASAALTCISVRGYRSALETSERASRRYLDLFQSAPDGVVALDAVGRILEANLAAETMLRRADLRGRLIGEVLDEVGARSNRPIEKGRSEAPAVVEIGAGRGARTFEVTARAGEDGSSLLILRETTERHALEEQLLHAQRLETVGLLAGGVAHDFNNLLTAIGGNAEILAEDEEPEVRELAQEILGAQKRGSALTRQLLAFARRDQRKVQRMDLSGAMLGMERLLARLLAEHHRLTLRVEGEAPVLADQAQIEQVAVNLVANARDASPPDAEVVVTVRRMTREGARALGCSLPGDMAMLEVSDSGAGMTPETRARIFEPFFTTKPRGQGTGLGLATVHGIVAQSGGQIAVDTAPARGTTFRVFLPLATVGSDEEGPYLTPVPMAGTGERILVVEDDPGVRILVERVLRTAGYVVTGAGSGAAALEILASGRQQTHLLVTDMAMPGMDGPEVARRVREQCPAVGVLFMTGYFEADEAQAPDPAVLRKPFTPEELLKRVREALKSRRAA